jgi:predicted Zn-dependent protease
MVEPGEAYWPHRMAELYVEADSSGRALSALDRALAADPDYNPSLSLTSKLWFEAGRHAEAISLLEAARARQGELPEALRLGLALHYEAVGRWDESAALFATTSQQPSSCVIYHMLRGESFLNAGEMAAAALREDPRSAANHNNYGITRLYAGDPNAAKAAFLEALELDPDLTGAIYNLAIVETFYFFDEAAGRDWFQLYRERGALEDPDGLSEIFAEADARAVQEQARR